MNVKNILNILNSYCDNSYAYFQSLPTKLEENAAQYLFMVLEIKLKENQDSEIDKETLDFDNIYSSEDDEEEHVEENLPNLNSNGDSVSYKLKCKAVELYKEHIKNGKCTLKLTTIARLSTTKLKSWTQLYRWQNQVENGGVYREKIKEINSHVYAKFVNTRMEDLPVRDRDLKRWALSFAKTLNITFLASDSWLLKLKKSVRISSRKTTDLLSFRKKSERGKLTSNLNSFREEVKEQFIKNKYKTSEFINFDHIGVAKELLTNRTLSFTGERKTYLVVNSVSNTTHSTTMLPGIKFDGTTFPKMLVCLQEPKGFFGPKISKDIDEYGNKMKNIFIVCSSSGKMSIQLTRNWVQHCLLSEMQSDRMLLMLDSWSGQWNERVWANIPNNINIEKCKIPKSCTAEGQPLDVGFNSYFKYFIRRINSYALLEKLDISIGQRENILKMASLVYNQLSSPKFKSLIIHAFCKAGYSNDKAPQFLNVRDACFINLKDECVIRECTNEPFLCCSHCADHLCFNHFFLEYHVHF